MVLPERERRQSRTRAKQLAILPNRAPWREASVASGSAERYASAMRNPVTRAFYFFGPIPGSEQAEAPGWLSFEFLRVEHLWISRIKIEHATWGIPASDEKVVHRHV